MCGDVVDINLAKKTVTVLLDNGEAQTIDTTYYKGLQLGYATTIHKPQGRTVDHAFVLFNGMFDRRLSYVALSRQKKTLKMYVNKEKTPDTQVLIRQMKRQGRMDITLDYDTDRSG